MHIKVWIISLLLLAGPLAVFAQLRPEGEWELDKVNMKLMSEPGNSLLEERNIDSLPSQITIVGKSILLNGQNYMIRFTQGVEQGTYVLLSDGSIAFRKGNRPPVDGQLQQPDIFCKISMPDADKMFVALPAEVYKDHTRNIIVKQFFICQYNRKK